MLLPRDSGRCGARLVLRGPGASLLLERLQDSGALELLRGILEPTLGSAPPAAASEAAAPPAGGPEPEPAAAADLCVPVEVLALAGRLQTIQGVCPAARVVRAWELGKADKTALGRPLSSGPLVLEPDPVPELRATVWVCLNGGRGAPFWTQRGTTLASRVREVGRPGRPFLPRVVRRGFASRAELECYLVGADAPWPPEV